MDKRIVVRLPRLLDKDLREVCRLQARAQSIELNIAPLSTASITLEDGSGVAIRSFVELYNAKGSVGIFRVNMPDESYGSGERIALEHGICTLDDAIISGQGEITGTPADVLRQILTHQTTKARGQNIWILGTVEAPESMTITVEHDGTKTLEMLAKAMQELQGYMLTFDQGAFPWVVNVVKKPEAVACEGRLSRNIRTIRKTMDDSDLCTRLYCSLLDGGYIESDTIGVWGEVEQSITLNDDMPKDDAIAYCQRYLDNRKNPVLAVQMDATEWFTLTGERLDRFEIGDVCRIALPEYGVTLEERIVALSYADALGTPELATVSLANQIEDMSIRSAKTTQDVDSLKSTSTSYGSRIATSETNLTNMKDQADGFKIIQDKMIHWYSSVEIDLDATEDFAKFGALASYKEVHDLTSEIDYRIAEAELILHGDGTSANAGLVAKVEENSNGIVSQNAALLDLKADTESATAMLSTRVGENEAALVLHADELGTLAEIKADKVDLGKYATVERLEAEIAEVKITDTSYLVTAALSTQSLDANYVETNSLNVGNQLGKWITRTNFVKSITLTAKDFTKFTDGEGYTRAIPNSWTVGYNRDDINYFGYE